MKPDGGDDDGDKSDSSNKGEDTDDDDGSQSQDKRWFANTAPIINLVNETSKKVCKFPAFFCVSIDEQMKKFKGCSGQTFRMKNKPISEGYKFWAICCANSGCCYHFIPAPQTGNVEERKIIEVVLLLLGKLPPERIETICCNNGQPFHFVQGSFRSKGDECCHLWYCKSQARLATETVQKYLR